uniref:Inhibitor of nuclear factor kappa B kinase subunit epsilon n=1 Tax=Suricata suricatta TaxID=37032 RepID=A0A673T763_SURSU
MTVDSSMSSGYCSLEEELEDCFFTAKTTFFRNVQSKQTPKNVCKPPEETQRPPTLQEIKQKIDSYNTREQNCLGMKLSEDGTYTGFIKVHLKLRRPVTVPAGIRPQSIYDAIKEVNLAATTDKRTSFYLPLDAIKQLHISSTTTVSEVIQGLLKKFMVVDNPQKFALFKRIHKDGQVLFQKLSIADCPLYLRLLAGPDSDVLSFVLKENETGEVELREADTRSPWQMNKQTEEGAGMWPRSRGGVRLKPGLQRLSPAHLPLGGLRTSCQSLITPLQMAKQASGDPEQISAGTDKMEDD